jgi:hypothetical protein
VSLRNSNTQIDLEFASPDQLENFLIIVEHLHSTATMESETQEEAKEKR